MNNEELDEKSKEVYKKILEYKDKLKKYINICNVSKETSVNFDDLISNALIKGKVYKSNI
jgi:hypothetical protein